MGIGNASGAGRPTMLEFPMESRGRRPLQSSNRASARMRRAPSSPSVDVVTQALLLRKTQPDLPALEVLDKVMRGRHGKRIDFSDLALPPAPFALLVAEAFDRGMLPGDRVGLWQHNGSPELRPFLLQLWTDEVWPQFMVRHSLYC